MLCRRFAFVLCFILAVTGFASTPNGDEPTHDASGDDADPEWCGSALNAPAVAVFSDTSDARLWLLSFGMLPYPIFSLSGPHLDALLASFAQERDFRERLAVTASRWPELAAMGLSATTIETWLGRETKFERFREDVADARRDLATFETAPESGREEVEFVVRSNTAQIHELRKSLLRHGSLSATEWRMWNSVSRDLATLQLVTFRTRSPLALAGAEFVRAHYAHLKHLLDFTQILNSIRYRPHETTFPGRLIQAIAGNIHLLDDVAEFCRVHVDPHTYTQLVLVVLRSNVDQVADGHWNWFADEAREVARRLAPSMFLAPTPQITGARVPLVNQLAALGGQRVVLRLSDKTLRSARLIGPVDYNLDVEDSEPKLQFIDGHGKWEEVSLTDVATITQGQTTLYDSRTDPPVARRAWQLSVRNRNFLYLLADQNVRLMDDYLIKRDRVVEVARELAQDSEAAGELAEWGKLFAAVDKAPETDFAAMHPLRDAVAMRLVAAYAMHLATLDVGPQRRDALRCTAAGMFLMTGEKGWGDIDDMRHLLRDDPALIATFDRADRTLHPALTLLHRSTDAAADAFLAYARLSFAAHMGKDLRYAFRAVDLQWKPTVEKVLDGKVPAWIHFLPTAQATIAQRTHLLLKRLLRPDSFPLGGTATDAAALKPLTGYFTSVHDPLGRRDKDQLLEALGRIAQDPPINTVGHAASLETAIRAQAGALREAVQAAPTLPWEAMDLGIGED